MSNINALEAITAQFEAKPEDMPRISTSSTKTKYTFLKLFQEALDANAMTIASDTTELCRLALTRSAEDFFTANDDITFGIPVSPGATHTTPARIATHTSATSLLLNPNATAETTDPFPTQESQRIFGAKQRQYTRYLNAKMSLRNCILKSVDDEYIQIHKNKLTRYAKVSPPSP